MSEVKSEYTIEIPGMDKYLVGTDGGIYKKACIDSIGRARSVFKVRFNTKEDIFLLNKKRYSLEELDPHLKEIDECDSVVLVAGEPYKSPILNRNK